MKYLSLLVIALGCWSSSERVFEPPADVNCVRQAVVYRDSGRVVWRCGYHAAKTAAGSALYAAASDPGEYANSVVCLDWSRQGLSERHLPAKVMPEQDSVFSPNIFSSNILLPNRIVNQRCIGSTGSAVATDLPYWHDSIPVVGRDEPLRMEIHWIAEAEAPTSVSIHSSLTDTHSQYAQQLTPIAVEIPAGNNAVAVEGDVLFNENAPQTVFAF